MSGVNKPTPISSLPLVNPAYRGAFKAQILAPVQTPAVPTLPVIPGPVAY